METLEQIHSLVDPAGMGFESGSQVEVTIYLASGDWYLFERVAGSAASSQTQPPKLTAEEWTESVFELIDTNNSLLGSYRLRTYRLPRLLEVNRQLRLGYQKDDAFREILCSSIARIVIK